MDKNKKPREKTNPLWVQCKNCHTWNAKEVGDVAKYLDRYLNAMEEKLRGMKGTMVGDEIAQDEPPQSGEREPRP